MDFFKVADLSMGDLLLHTTVTWLNPPASLGKWKKEPQMATFGTNYSHNHKTDQELFTYIFIAFLRSVQNSSCFCL